jgi:hypothetical protein
MTNPVDPNVTGLIEGELKSALGHFRSNDVLSIIDSMDSQRRRLLAAFVCVEEVAHMKITTLLDSAEPLTLLKCALHFLDNAGQFTSLPAREHISALCDLIAPLERRL